MKITTYDNESKLRSVAKARGWKFAASLPVPPNAKEAAELRNTIARNYSGRKVTVAELLRDMDCNGSESDYMIFHR